MFEQRLARLRRRMEETGTDLVVLGPTSHLVWLTGLSPHGDERPVLLAVTRDGAGMLMPALNVDSQRKKTDLPFFVWADADGPHAALAGLLQSLGLTGKTPRVVLDEMMRADFALLLLDALPGATRSFTAETVGALRAIKDEDEFGRLKRNAVLNDRVLEEAFAALRPGVTEDDIANVIREAYRGHGAQLEFVSVCFGENGAFPHHTSTQRVLGANEAILIDLGGRSEGYPSDMTRVGTIGTPPAEFGAVWDVVEKAVQAALAAARPGVPARMVDKAARDVITAAGYGANFPHRTGHGLGIDGHETPYITASSEQPLEVGNVFSIEPGVYLPGKFGIRLEEIVILRADGPEIFSDLPRTPLKAGG
jgi:Xaa-Pro aminopeptidase